MASVQKFGLYDPGSSKPLQEYEGEYLQFHGESVVCVVAGDGAGHERIVAAIRLAERQSVKKIS